ncbi:MAG: NAD-dependent epimerase/dehydratase family protein [Bacteroidales bacterium]
MKVLITGANGLLATHTIRELLARGYKVRGFLRNHKKIIPSLAGSIELIEGDIRSMEDVDQAVKQCDHVIHNAAATDPSVSSYKFFQHINVYGTHNIIQAAKHHKVKKLVYVSTANTMGHGNKKTPGNETSPPEIPFIRSPYVRSKIESEQLALTESENIPLVIVNPSFMTGSYGSGNGSDKIVRMGMKKHIVFYPPGGKNFIHVEDAARGLVNALKKGKTGERYLLCNENLTYQEFFTKVKALSPHNPTLIKIPPYILITAGYLGSLARMAGLKTSFSINNAKILCTENYYTGDKARELLPEQLQTIDKAIADTIAWLS